MLIWIFAALAACLLLERLAPGWRLPAVQGWWWRVLAVNAAQLAIVVIAGVSWERWAQQASLVHLPATWPAWAGGLLAYFIATFVFYWWHRARHEVHWLWLGFHQIHHSPQRLQVITSFYKHPVEMWVNSLLGSLLVYAVLGLSPQAGAVYTLCTALGEFFYHTNVRTPRWIGYVFQRPEMHRIHHEHDKHRNKTATSSGGTCSSAPTTTRQPGTATAATAAAASKSWVRCCAGAMCTSRPPGRSSSRMAHPPVSWSDRHAAFGHWRTAT